MFQAVSTLGTEMLFESKAVTTNWSTGEHPKTIRWTAPSHEVLQISAGLMPCPGLLFGNVSYISLSPTRLNGDAGGVDRGSGLFAAALCICWIFLGSELTACVPKFMVGGRKHHF